SNSASLRAISCGSVVPYSFCARSSLASSDILMPLIRPRDWSQPTSQNGDDVLKLGHPSQSPFLEPAVKFVSFDAVCFGSQRFRTLLGGRRPQRGHRW